MALTPAWLPRNQNGGYYAPGKSHGLAKKLEVYDTYCQMVDTNYPTKPSTRQLAKEARVGQTYALKIIQEVDEFGGVLDPSDIKVARKQGKRIGVGCNTLTPIHEAYLLALHASNPCTPLKEYVKELFIEFNIVVSESTLSNWFLRGLNCKGGFRKVNKVPIDKFRPTNVAKYFTFMEIRKTITNPFLWNFIDEKHFVNGDAVPNRVRANPLN